MSELKVLKPLPYPPNPGDELRGSHGNYRIGGQLGLGGRGNTFWATTQLGDGRLGTRVVVKLPSLDLTRSASDIRGRLHEIKADMEREINAWARLRESPAAERLIADVVDAGSYHAKINGELCQVDFLIQEFIPGLELQKWCADKWAVPVRGSRTKRTEFRGIPDVRQWFDLATKITQIIKVVHDQRVIHGDIWPTNIMIRRASGLRADPVLIDFGQAWLLDRTFVQASEDPYRYAYYAPERYLRERRTWYAPADIYSLGGILYFLAAGQDPPSPYRQSSDERSAGSNGTFKTNTELKDEITAKIHARNPILYAGNLGIVDIIHYCMRPWADERAPHAGAVLETLGLFRNAFVSPRRSYNSRAVSVEGMDRTANVLRTQNATLGSVQNHFFYRMVGRNIESIIAQLQTIGTRLYTLSGSRDELVNGLLSCMSCLRSGDQCLALTTPLFWERQNAGANGRFLTMLKMAALAGISVRWVQLFTEEEYLDPKANVPATLAAQNRAMIETQDECFRRDGHPHVNITDKSLNGRGFFFGYCIVDEAVRERIVRQANTFIVFNRRSNRQDNYTLVAPAYSQRGGVMTVVRFWESPTRWNNELRPRLEEFLTKSISVLHAPSVLRRT